MTKYITEIANIETALDTCRQRMTPTYIYNFLEHVSALMVAKGYSRQKYGSSWVEIEHDGTARISLMHKDSTQDPHNFYRRVESISDLAILNALKEIYAEAKEYKTHDDFRRTRWYETVKQLERESAELNLGFEYTEMLRATAEKYAKNSLEHKSLIEE